MINVTEEIKNPKNYILLAFGLVLGAGILAIATNYQLKKMNSAGINNITGQSAVTTANGVTVPQVSESYKEALKNPDKPYTDERGITHPPIGGGGVVSTTPVDPLKVVAPPIGGNGKAPVAPTAPPVPSPIVPATTKASTTAR
jgi:hypothetical protein